MDGIRRLILHAREHIGEIFEGIDPARFASSYERVQPREADTGITVVDEEIILPAERDAAQGAL